MTKNKFIPNTVTILMHGKMLPKGCKFKYYKRNIPFEHVGEIIRFLGTVSKK